jgi:hypothetical protein
LALALALAPVRAQTLPAGYHEDLRLEVTNTAGAEVRASRDGGQSWLVVGHTLRPAARVNPLAYRAAAWVPDSSVAATAVNAIHLKITNHADSGRAIAFSLVPQGPIEGDAEPDSSVMLDTPPAEGIFGGLGPTVGSPLRLWRGNAWQPLPPDYVPGPGDRWLIVRMVPDRALRYVDLENIFGGKITVTYADGGTEVIGHVLTPVTGIGRFEGMRYASPGRLRANHAGVLDVSTAPYGMVGGFQIIPWDHANDTEMDYVRTNRQWLVVGPVDMASGSWEAHPPLFWGTFYPSYRRDDLDHDDWPARLLSRTQVLCKRGGDWEPLPQIAFSTQAPLKSPRPKFGVWLIWEPADIYKPLPPAADSALADIRAFRLCLPMTEFWPEEASANGAATH